MTAQKGCRRTQVHVTLRRVQVLTSSVWCTALAASSSQWSTAAHGHHFPFVLQKVSTREPQLPGLKHPHEFSEPHVTPDADIRRQRRERHGLHRARRVL